VVTTDASDSLAAFDDRLDEDGEEREATPMIDADTGIVMEPPAPPAPPTREEQRDFLYTCEGVFLDELLPETEEAVQEWLEQFDIENQTDAISTLLNDHPHTLGDTFSKLTDQVEYAEFWKRYFYRLADERFDATYDEYHELHIQQQEEELYAASQNKNGAGAALTSMTNFLGGAVKRLVEETGDNDDAVTPLYNATAQSFFGGGGRPPFVLNTAVSEDEDQDEEEEEEEEEEELGWDDDDEEDGDDDDDDEDGHNQEDDNSDAKDHQIEFKDAEKERMQEELAQAMTERDSLHTTVEMQTHEIQKLKELSSEAGGDDTKQVEALKLQIFEKDAELAALRARLDDTHEDDVEKDDGAKQASQERELERLTKGVSERDAQLADLQEQLVHTNEALAATQHALQEERDQKQQVLEEMAAKAQSDKAALERANEETADCKTQLQALQETVSLMQSENTQSKEVQQQHDSSDHQAQQQLFYAQQGMEEAKADLEHFQAQTVQLQADLDASKTQTESLDAELLQTKAALKDAKTELTKAAARPSSPGSSSTGVKVPEVDEEVKVPVLPEGEVPVVPEVKVVPEVEEVQEQEQEKPAVTKVKSSDDGEEDAWGDDW
jgi:hypothetical protein